MLVVLLSTSFSGLVLAQDKCGIFGLCGKNPPSENRFDGSSKHDNRGEGLWNGFSNQSFNESEPCFGDKGFGNEEEGVLEGDFSDWKGPQGKEPNSCEGLPEFCEKIKKERVCNEFTKNCEWRGVEISSCNFSADCSGLSNPQLCGRNKSCEWKGAGENGACLVKPNYQCVAKQAFCPKLYIDKGGCCPYQSRDSFFGLNKGVYVRTCIGTHGCFPPQQRFCSGGFCGDGILQPNNRYKEECDLGTRNSNTGACTKKCKKARCGDGFTQTNVEQCDDGNLKDGDGCSAQCKKEADECKTLKVDCKGKSCPLGYTCSGPSQYICYRGQCGFYLE